MRRRIFNRRAAAVVPIILVCYSCANNIVVAWVLQKPSAILPHRHRSTTLTTLKLQSTIQPKWWNNCDMNELPYESSLLALEAYHRANGNLAIPGNFVVPSTNEYPVEWHGVKLSRYIYNMKWWQKHIAQHSDRVSQLNSLSFVWERLQSPWNLLIDALGHYRSIYGNVLVPAKYVVPRTDDYPKACWDLPLGRTVQRLRIRHDFLQGDSAIERKNQLDGLGFCWDVSEYNFIRFLKVLRHYDRLEKESLTLRGENSAIRVPSKYVIPNDERWPKEFWGYQLGAKCMAVRQKKLYIKSDPERKQALEDIGFRFNGNASLGWLDVVHAAAIYSQMHGRVLNVPLSFSVPSPTEHPECLDEWPWPERLWGLKLGQRLRDVRLKGAYLKGRDRNVRIAQLNNLGFIWQPKRGRRKRSTHDEEEDIINDDTIRPVVDDDAGEHV